MDLCEVESGYQHVNEFNANEWRDDSPNAVNEKIDAENPTMLATGGEYRVVPSFAPTAEAVLALEHWDPRLPRNGSLPFGRNLARLASIVLAQ